jgi:type I restriction-modification system DNA methylase subunit
MQMNLNTFNKNKAIEEMVLNKEKNNEPYSQEDMAFANLYVGYGGMWKFDDKLPKERGLYEYYTPVTVIEKMISLVVEYGYKGGKVLEPSCGIGRFLHYFHPKTKVTAIEPDKTSFLIAQANFPTFDIQNKTFNELFVDRRGNKLSPKGDFELVIGNPPYGTFSGRHSVVEKRQTLANTYVDYFITRGLDLLKKDGLLAYIIPSGFIDSSETEVKRNIMRKSELVDAYRLPRSIFSQTDLQTDIIILKKL